MSCPRKRRAVAQLAVAQLRVEQTKDERKDDAAWHTRYEYSMWTKVRMREEDSIQGLRM